MNGLLYNHVLSEARHPDLYVDIRGQFVRIRTSCLYPDSDYVYVYCYNLDTIERITLTDLGNSFQYVREIPSRSDDIQTISSTVRKAFDVSIDRGVLTTHRRIDEALPTAIYRLAAASVFIAHISLADMQNA
jgi:hypothetical protein